ncbi:TetR family transcriptional regulator [Lysinimonas soli]|uniref:TetR family transcriptional regulator n=1 Tax=Lysinimonas soli TaxID=1074233 RepID=A0ABW0NPN5_9MICO
MSAARNTSRHDREAVVDTALRLLDEVGLPDLTMRRLGAELDVQPSALYWHIENKQALLAAVADRIQAAARPSPPAELGWRDATAAEAAAIRDALLAYRDGAEVVLSTRALGLGGDEAHRRLVRALERGHDSATARVVATALLHLVFGDAALVQQRLQADVLGVTSDAVGMRPELTPDDDEAFRTGVDLLLAGLEQRASIAD